MLTYVRDQILCGAWRGETEAGKVGVKIDEV